MNDKFSQYLHKMWKSSDYLDMNCLKNEHSYKIVARNAYAGIWIEAEKAFLISRYDIGDTPYLAYENHWDKDERFGTVKPIELTEKCPIVLKANHCYWRDNRHSNITTYLDELEENNPLIEGYNSLLNRRNGAIRYAKREKVEIEMSQLAKSIGLPMRKLEKIRRMDQISKRFIKTTGRKISNTELCEKLQIDLSQLNYQLELTKKTEVQRYIELSKIRVNPDLLDRM